MKAKFIINPHSGRGKGKRAGEQIKQLLREHPHLDWSWVETAWAGETIPLAQAAVEEGCELLVAVGGDGTVNEVMNVAAQAGKILGVIPAGTGNDLARTLYIPTDVREAFFRLCQGKPYSVDAGKINGRYFLNAAGMGIDAQILRDVNEGKFCLRGKAAYVMALLKNLLFFKAQKVILEIDGQIFETDALLVVVANGRYFGGGMMIAPQADLTDGIFDVYVIQKMSKLSFLISFPKIYKGAHARDSRVNFFQAKHVVLAVKDDAAGVQCDGEIIGQTPQKIVCCPKKVQILL